jgi:hypothetical protein
VALGEASTNGALAATGQSDEHDIHGSVVAA